MRFVALPHCASAFYAAALRRINSPGAHNVDSTGKLFKNSRLLSTRRSEKPDGRERRRERERERETNEKALVIRARTYPETPRGNDIYLDHR